MYFSAHNDVLAQTATTPNVTPPLTRTFDPGHFNRHELHDVLQLAVGKLPNTLRLARAASPPSQPQQ